MNSLIVANWKMNPQTLAEAKEIFGAVAKGIREVKDAEIVICPPFVYLPELRIRSKELGIKLGAQDCFWEEKGAYTGEISSRMLRDSGCEYVIIGHSERRKILCETDEMINRKLKAVLSAGLKAIFCIGESAKERQEDKTNQVLERQFKEGLKSVGLESLHSNLIVAYEPVWAIGTGNPCCFSDGRLVISFLRKTIGEIPVIYGGSVKSENASKCIREAGFKGVLVGEASLDPDEFIKIALSC